MDLYPGEPETMAVTASAPKEFREEERVNRDGDRSGLLLILFSWCSDVLLKPQLFFIGVCYKIFQKPFLACMLNIVPSRSPKINCCGHRQPLLW